MRNKNRQDRGKELLTSHGILSDLEPLLLLGQHHLQLGDLLPLGLSLPFSKSSGCQTRGHRALYIKESVLG
jgi:hypothetical protein